MKNRIIFNVQCILLLLIFSTSVTPINKVYIDDFGQLDNKNTHSIAGSALIAYFQFNGDANDVSGNNYQIVLNNQIYYVAGKVGLGLASSGSTFDVNQITLPDLFTSDNFTISVWLKPEVDHNNNYGNTYFSVWHSSNQAQRSFIFSPSSGNLGSYPQHEYPELLIYKNSNTSFNYGDAQLNTDTWQHIAITSENRNMNVYVNGIVIIENKLADYSAVAQQLNITLRVNDLLDELRIYNRELSAAEVLDITQNTVDVIFMNGFE